MSIVIPTYEREEVLLDTVAALLSLETQANEIIVVDQTAKHHPATDIQLRSWHESGSVRWLKRTPPSITQSMNYGLVCASNDLVLFLDDDIIPHANLVSKHSEAHQADGSLWATVGQVIQPWQKPEAIKAPRSASGLKTDFDFPFNSTIDADIENVMAGNLCVNRRRALSIGGFDENFIGVAYRFESDFARRLIKAGGKIRFIGSAGIDHLRVNSGGTRTKGNHMTSASPVHGFGDYYYAFKHGKPLEAWKYSVQRLFREVRTRFHVTHPWWIPVKIFGEIRAFYSGKETAKRTMPNYKHFEN